MASFKQRGKGVLFISSCSSLISDLHTHHKTGPVKEPPQRSGKSHLDALEKTTPTPILAEMGVGEVLEDRRILCEVGLFSMGTIFRKDAIPLQEPGELERLRKRDKRVTAQPTFVSGPDQLGTSTLQRVKSASRWKKSCGKAHTTEKVVERDWGKKTSLFRPSR